MVQRSKRSAEQHHFAPPSDLPVRRSWEETAGSSRFGVRIPCYITCYHVIASACIIWGGQCQHLVHVWIWAVLLECQIHSWVCLKSGCPKILWLSSFVPIVVAFLLAIIRMNTQTIWKTILGHYCSASSSGLLRRQLVGGLEHFIIFPSIGNSHPNWLIFFQRGWNHQPGKIYWVSGDSWINRSNWWWGAT